MPTTPFTREKILLGWNPFKSSFFLISNAHFENGCPGFSSQVERSYLYDWYQWFRHEWSIRAIHGGVSTMNQHNELKALTSKIELRLKRRKWRANHQIASRRLKWDALFLWQPWSSSWSCFFSAEVQAAEEKNGHFTNKSEFFYVDGLLLYFFEKKAGFEVEKVLLLFL